MASQPRGDRKPLQESLPVIAGKRLIVVMPAYNAAATLEGVVARLPPEVDHVVLGDDASGDTTVQVARRLGLEVHVHPRNRGYGANQKTCYQAALAAGAEIVVMVHPDGQHDPSLLPELGRLVADQFDLALASRMQGREALVGGMPLHKYYANRALTAFQNRLLKQTLSEYHSGFRAYRRSTLEQIPYLRNAEGFLFDNQILLQALWRRLKIGEIPSPTFYGPQSSSIRLGPSIAYAAGVLGATLQYRLAAANGPSPDWLRG